MSLIVMEQYSDVTSELEDNVRDACDFYGFDYDEDNEDVEDVREGIYLENISYMIYELDSSKLPSGDTNELASEFFNDPEEFLDKYEIKDNNAI